MTPTPPAAVSTPLTDFDQLAAFFSRWNGRFEQLSAGRFAGSLRVVRGRWIRLVALEVNQSILARGQDNPGMFSVYGVTPGNAAGLWHGRRLTPGRVVGIGADAGADHRSARRCSYLGLSVPAAVFHEAAAALRTADLTAAPKSWSAFDPPPEASAALGRRFGRFLASDPASSGPSARVLEQECLRAVVEVVYPSTPASRSGLPPSSRAALVSRAEGLMRSDLTGGFGAVDLCRELGVSDRTLRLAFRERYGLGPMAFYKALRLNAVRVALKGAGPEALVAGVARGLGFHHLGNFAADYRRAFGEPPSTTLRG